MKKARNVKSTRHKRPIEDVPFYKIVHSSDDLPLDPFRPFIMEEINKFKQSKPEEFFHDFELYMAPRGNGQPSSVGLQLPDIFQNIGQESGPSFAFKSNSRKTNLNTTQARVHEVTKNLISIYKQKRMRVFRSMARTQAALLSKEFFQIYLAPSKAIARKKTLFKSKFHPKAKQKPFDYKLEYERLRGLRESEEELAKVQAYIDKMIEKNIRKMEAEKRKKQGTKKPTVEEKCQYTTLTELLNKPREKTPEPRKRKKPISNEQFLKKLKEKDLEQSRYLQAILPTHPDEQILKSVRKFTEQNNLSSKKFDDNMRQRMLNLFDELSVNQIETYPSKHFKLILKIIDGRKGMWQKASKFIAEEEKLWPDVRLEVILMDFLFNPENKVRREIAVMIVCLLMDLQEDYRYNIKRGFMRNILRCEIERKRLQLELEPPEFPIATIKAPVPWKCSVQVSKNRLEEVLMVNHPVLQAIQMLWYNLYHDLLIVDTAKFYRCEIPYHAENITEIINSCCKITRDVSDIYLKGDELDMILD